MLRSFSNTVRKFNVHLNPFLGTRHETPNLLVAGNVYQRQYSGRQLGTKCNIAPQLIIQIYSHR